MMTVLRRLPPSRFSGGILKQPSEQASQKTQTKASSTSATFDSERQQALMPPPAPVITPWPISGFMPGLPWPEGPTPIEPLIADSFTRMAQEVNASIEASNRLFASVHQQLNHAMANAGTQTSAFQQVSESSWTPSGGQFRSVTTENGKTVLTQGVFHPGLVATQQGPYRVAYTVNPSGIALQWRHHTEGTGGTQTLLKPGTWAQSLRSAVPPVAIPHDKTPQDPHEWLLFYNAQNGKGEPVGVGLALLNRASPANKDQAPIKLGGHLSKAVGPKTLMAVSQACLTEDNKWVVLIPSPKGNDLPKPVTLELAPLMAELHQHGRKQAAATSS
jgi:hypothetical protein